jgi:hypothetical protein
MLGASLELGAWSLELSRLVTTRRPQLPTEASIVYRETKELHLGLRER